MRGVSTGIFKEERKKDHGTRQHPHRHREMAGQSQPGGMLRQHDTRILGDSDEGLNDAGLCCEKAASFSSPL